LTVEPCMYECTMVHVYRNVQLNTRVYEPFVAGNATTDQPCSVISYSNDSLINSRQCPLQSEIIENWSLNSASHSGHCVTTSVCDL